MPKLKLMKKLADDIDKKRAKEALSVVAASPKVSFMNKEDMAQSAVPALPTIKPLLKKRIDDNKVFSRVKNPKDPNLII